jgi:hypothetical protein
MFSCLLCFAPSQKGLADRKNAIGFASLTGGYNRCLSLKLELLDCFKLSTHVKITAPLFTFLLSNLLDGAHYTQEFKYSC